MAVATPGIAGFSPQVGIERIIGSNDGPGSALLPASTRVLPSDSAQGMEALHDLYASSWDKALQNYLKPAINARELFIPGVFNGRLRQARKELVAEARAGKKDSLRQAALLLEDDEEMQELLMMYRNLLLQG